MVIAMNFRMAMLAQGNQILWHVRATLVKIHNMVRNQASSLAASATGVTVTLKNLSTQSAPLLFIARTLCAALPVVMIRAANLGYHFRWFGDSTALGCTPSDTFRRDNLTSARLSYLLSSFFRCTPLTLLFFRFLAHRYTLVPSLSALVRFAHLLLGFFRMRLMVPLGWRRLIPQWIAVMFPSLVMHDAIPVGMSPTFTPIDCAFLFWFSHERILPHKLNVCNVGEVTTP